MSNTQPQNDRTDCTLANPTEALATAARLVQDDLVLMIKRDGKTIADIKVNLGR